MESLYASTTPTADTTNNTADATTNNIANTTTNNIANTNNYNTARTTTNNIADTNNYNTVNSTINNTANTTSRSTVKTTSAAATTNTPGIILLIKIIRLMPMFKEKKVHSLILYKTAKNQN